MKRLKSWLCLAVFAAICLPAAAQSTLRFNVPFNFVAGGKLMLAGEYKVAPTFGDDNAAWVVVGAGNSVMLLTNAVQSTTSGHEASLVFLQSGGRFSLVEIWPSEYSGREMLRSKLRQTLIAQGAKYVEVSAE